MYDSFLAWQDKYDHRAVHEYMQSGVEIPVFAIMAYLYLIFGVPSVIEKSGYATEKYVRLPMILWNIFLSVFSCMGTYYMIGPWFNTLTTRGIFGLVCVDADTQGLLNGAPGFWLMLFVLSKIPEMVDTIWLVLQRKPVIVLHGHHHATVMLYCWYSYVHQTQPGPSFAIVNYSVHSVMYAFFALSGVKGVPGLKKALKVVSPFITSIQLIQMFAGMFLLFAQRYYNSIDEKTCPMHRSANGMGIWMYASYAVLFGLLFRDKYCGGGAPSSSGGKAAASSAGGKRGTAARASVAKQMDDGELCNATASAMMEIHPSEPTDEMLKKND